MTTKKKNAPAPGATGHEGHESKNLHGTGHPGYYHLTAYYDAGAIVTKCRKRLRKQNNITSATPPTDTLLCPLCDAAEALEAVIW